MSVKAVFDLRLEVEVPNPDGVDKTREADPGVLKQVSPVGVEPKSIHRVEKGKR